MDRIYLNTDEENIYFLDCTRLDGNSDLVTRNNPLDKKDVDDFLRIQSCQIIFPQIRSIVATLTSSAFIQPILLPVIDARKLFATSNPATKE